MFSTNNLNTLIEAILTQLNQKNLKKDLTSNPQKEKQKIISPAEALIILGLIGGVFQVESLQIDRDQIVNIVLSGSLKRETEMDKILNKIGDMKFEDVMKAILERYG